MNHDVKPGIHMDMPDQEYFSLDAANRSSLVDFERTPMHYQYNRSHPRSPTPAMAFGTAFHTLVLEPARFQETTHVIDVMPRKGSKAHTELMEEVGDKLILSSRDYDRLVAMRRSLLFTDTGSALFEGEGFNEFVVVFDDPYTKIRCKTKIDRMTWLGDEPVAIDLKTTIDASIDAFQKTDSRLFYSSQAAFYLHSLDVVNPIDTRRRFVFAVVEKDPPFGVAFFEPDVVALDEGRMQYERWLERLRHAGEHGFSGYPDEIQTLELAPWVLAKRIREENEAE